MHARLFAALVLTALWVTPLAQAVVPSPHGLDPQGEDYYARVETQEGEAPQDGGRHRACGGDTGPDSFSEALEYDQRQVWDGSTRWSLPYVAPECLVVDSRGATAEAQEMDACPGIEWKVACRQRDMAPGIANAVSPMPYVHHSYNLSSGEYYFEAGAPLDVNKSGRLPFTIRFDCRDCPPPWSLGP